MGRYYLQGLRIGAAPIDETDFAPSEEMKVLNEANAKMQWLDDRITDLAKNWKPTGLYTSAELLKGTMDILHLMSSATSAIREAPISSDDIRMSLITAANGIFKYANEGGTYIKLANEAKSGELISAPGFKDWVVKSSLAIYHGMITATVAQRNMHWLATFLIDFQKGFDAYFWWVTAIAGAVKDAGQKIIEAPGKAMTLAKIGIGLGIGFLGYQLVKK